MQDTNHSAAKPDWLQVVLVGRRHRTTLLRILVLVSVCAVTFKFVLLPIRVTGISMEPTYHDRRIGCVNTLAYLWHEPQRGDVVSVRYADPGPLAEPSVMLMKRIVGMPGETVTFHQGHAYIDGQLLDEPYVKFQCDWEHGPIRCGPDEYFVVGDNRSMPFELHVHEVVARDRIIGKVI